MSEYVKEKGVRQFLLKNLYWKSKGQLALRMNLPVLTKNIDEVGEPLTKEAKFSGETLFLGGENSGYIRTNGRNIDKKTFPQSKNTNY